MSSESSIKKYRNGENSFTRCRKLTFPRLVVLLLQKSVKSLQIKLNEVSEYLEGGVTASAFVQARSHLSYRFFEDSNINYTRAYYEEESDYSNFKGHRVLAIDGTQVRLPRSEEVYDEFGKIKIQLGNGELDYYSSSLCSVLYDVYNDLVLNGIMGRFDDSERRQAEEHLELCAVGDLVILDRGYPSRQLMSAFHGQGVHFLMRTKTSGRILTVIKEFVENSNSWDQLVKLPLKTLSANDNLEVRLLKIKLDSGEVEVLITSLLDQVKYPIDDFKALYFRRWRIETYFDILKNRLALENFTGKSIESIKQDFYSTLLLSNIESDISSDVNQELKNEQKKQYSYQVNKKVSYSVIKQRAFDIFCNGVPDDQTITKLQQLFRKSTVPIRKNRRYKRNPSITKTANYSRYYKKIAF